MVSSLAKIRMMEPSFRRARECVPGQGAVLIVSRWLTSQFARLLKGIPEEAWDAGQRDKDSFGNRRKEGGRGFSFLSSGQVALGGAGALFVLPGAC